MIIRTEIALKIPKYLGIKRRIALNQSKRKFKVFAKLELYVKCTLVRLSSTLALTVLKRLFTSTYYLVVEWYLGALKIKYGQMSQNSHVSTINVSQLEVWLNEFLLHEAPT